MGHQRSPRPIRWILPAALLLAAGAPAAAPSDETYARLIERAEGHFEEGSYARAGKLYLEAAQLDLTPPQARWVTFRLADTRWRAWVATRGGADHPELEDAQQDLEEIVADVSQRDRVWAEACEALGDLAWIRPESRDWSRAWPNYRSALDHWASSTDVARSGRRYLDIVWRAVEPIDRDPFPPGRPGVSLEILENARRIASQPDDVALANYLVAMKLLATGSRERGRIERAFDAALAVGRDSPWHDDALYHSAAWLAGEGTAPGRDGADQPAPDFLRALERYRALVDGYRKGESPYLDDAREQIRQISGPQIVLDAPQPFLPGADITFGLAWRNVPALELDLYRVDLTRDLDPEAPGVPDRWADQIDLEGVARFDRFTISTPVAGAHAWGGLAVTLPERPPVGAYVVVASGEGASARELLLILA